MRVNNSIKSDNSIKKALLLFTFISVSLMMFAQHTMTYYEEEYKGDFWSQMYDLRIGIKGGLGVNTDNWMRSGKGGILPGTNMYTDRISKSLRPAWEIGLVGQYTSLQNVFYQLELLFEGNTLGLESGNIIQDGITTNAQLSSVSQLGARLRFAAGCKVGLSQSSCFLIGSGVSGTYGLNYKVNTQNNYSADNFPELKKDISGRYLDLGVLGLAGIETARIQYTLNFTYNFNTIDTPEDMYNTHSWDIKFNIALFFRID